MASAPRPSLRHRDGPGEALPRPPAPPSAGKGRSVVARAGTRTPPELAGPRGRRKDDAIRPRVCGSLILTGSLAGGWITATRAGLGRPLAPSYREAHADSEHRETDSERRHGEPGARQDLLPWRACGPRTRAFCGCPPPPFALVGSHADSEPRGWLSLPRRLRTSTASSLMAPAARAHVLATHGHTDTQGHTYMHTY